MKKFISIALAAVLLITAGLFSTTDAFAKHKKKKRKHHKVTHVVRGPHETVRHTPGTPRQSGGSSTK